MASASGWEVSGHPPMGLVARSGVRRIIEEILAEWEQVEPENYRAWPAICERRRQSLHDGKGFSKSREIQIPWVMPPYVNLRLARSLGDPNWAIHMPEVMEELLSVMPCCRMSSTAGTRLDADR